MYLLPVYTHVQSSLHITTPLYHTGYSTTLPSPKLAALVTPEILLSLSISFLTLSNRAAPPCISYTQSAHYPSTKKTRSHLLPTALTPHSPTPGIVAQFPRRSPAQAKTQHTQRQARHSHSSAARRSSECALCRPRTQPILVSKI